MFTLVAASKKPIHDGIVATRQFETIEDAETLMRDWALYGVDNQCNEADLIYICDARAKLVRTWDWAKRVSLPA